VFLLLLLLLQARIEELLDDKADLEYEIDVVERKVELLREEVRTSSMQLSLSHSLRRFQMRCLRHGLNYLVHCDHAQGIMCIVELLGRS
jgi:hypothetical protein